MIFHDGTPFNAASVKFTIERVINPKTPGRVQSWLGPVTGANVVDDHTVDVITSSRFGPLLNHLTMVFVVGILSPDAVKKFGDDYLQVVAGPRNRVNRREVTGVDRRVAAGRPV